MTVASVSYSTEAVTLTSLPVPMVFVPWLIALFSPAAASFTDRFGNQRGYRFGPQARQTQFKKSERHQCSEISDYKRRIVQKKNYQ